MEKHAQAARAAGLRYGNDEKPGIRRVRSGPGFKYLSADGQPIRDRATIARIKSLVIPPAWTNVWISTDPRTHLQATGRDARRRKQYRYHPTWREFSHQTKYAKLAKFARSLPAIRRRIAADLRASTLSKVAVLAAIVQLLERTFIRIGNEEYVRQNGSFGLTTLRNRHVKVRGPAIQFQFKGKSGIYQTLTLTDARLARMLKNCQELPGQELFQYVGHDKRRHPITSADVNRYLREAVGERFSAKDFRTWAGTILAVKALSDLELGDTERESKSRLGDAVKAVAEHLGNTPAVCRACYIHPSVLEAYANGTLRRRINLKPKVSGLRGDELAALAVIESQPTFREQSEASSLALRRRVRALRRPAHESARSGFTAHTRAAAHPNRKRARQRATANRGALALVRARAIE
jgi:DNA topoisomerase-1